MLVNGGVGGGGCWCHSETSDWTLAPRSGGAERRWHSPVTARPGSRWAAASPGYNNQEDKHPVPVPDRSGALTWFLLFVAPRSSSGPTDPRCWARLRWRRTSCRTGAAAATTERPRCVHRAAGCSRAEPRWLIHPHFLYYQLYTCSPPDSVSQLWSDWETFSS